MKYIMFLCLLTSCGTTYNTYKMVALPQKVECNEVGNNSDLLVCFSLYKDFHDKTCKIREDNPDVIK